MRLLGLLLLLGSSALLSAAPLLSPGIGPQVTRAYTLYQQDQLTPALTLLESLTPKTGFDRAYVNRFRANLYWSLEQPEKALKPLTLAISEQALPAQEQQQAVRMLGDLLLTLEQPAWAITHYQTLIRQGVLEPGLLGNLAQAYYQLEAWDKVVTAARQAIDLTPEFNQSLHLLLLSSYYRLEDYRAAVPLLQRLTQQQPTEKHWWLQLASAHLQLNELHQALASYELAYRAGLLDQPQELTTLASLRAAQGAPLHAARLLAQSLKSGRLTADAATLRTLAGYWQAAREYREAARTWGSIEGDAEAALHQAELLALLGDYNRILKVLEPLKPDSPHLELKVALRRTHAHYALKGFGAALASARQALQLDPDNAQAQSWVQLLQSRQ